VAVRCSAAPRSRAVIAALATKRRHGERGSPGVPGLFLTQPGAQWIQQFARGGAVYTMLDEKDALINSSGRCAVPNGAFAAVDGVVHAVLEGQRHPTSATQDLARWHIDFLAAERKAHADDPDWSQFP
jgi:hypothetical protein